MIRSVTDSDDGVDSEQANAVMEIISAIQSGYKRRSPTSSSNRSALPPGCVFCKGEHSVYTCPKVKDIAGDQQQLRLLLGALKKFNQGSDLQTIVSALVHDSPPSADDSEDVTSDETSTDFR